MVFSPVGFGYAPAKRKVLQINAPAVIYKNNESGMNVNCYYLFSRQRWHQQSGRYLTTGLNNW